MKIRIKYQREGAVRFLGHLDMMRYFQKAIRRAEIDICYSEGYSPHQIMSFATPIGVGITSEGEYFDIEVHSSLSSRDAIAALNATMVDGILVTGYVLLPDNAKTAMSLVAAADYRLTYKEGFISPLGVKEWQSAIRENFLEQEQFRIIKQTKKSEREVDLKPLVYRLEVRENTLRQPEFLICVSTGSNDNIKPDLVLSSIYEKLGLTYDANAIQVHRVETYARDEESGHLVSLLALGKDIE